MRVREGIARAVCAILLAAVAAPAIPTQAARAAEASDDASDIVLVLDFSGSILDDAAVRTDFATALEGIAARVDETAATLAAGDATVSIVRFATRAADLDGCTALRLREDPAAVAALAECLRRVATAYRNGVDPALTAAIGDDTNYVAAMERAATHLPEGSARPAIIFFTDGRHEASGVPVSQVVPARERLFGERSPFALLPVGMGLDPDDRPTLEAGLADLRVSRDFERCEGGALAWPTVVFDSAEAAGQAVGVALQDVSCTFTVEPTATPAGTPTPPPPEPVQGIRLTPADATIALEWFDPVDVNALPVEGYMARCRPAAGGDWVDATIAADGLSATVDGLANGVEYQCEVAAIRSAGPDPWTAAAATATPFGRPPAPLKPSAQVIDQGVRLGIAMPADAPVDTFRVECSSDGGASWTATTEADGRLSEVRVDGLANGTEYVCRAFAANASGASDASALTDAFRPCAGILDCNPIVLPVFAGALVLLVVSVLIWLLRFAAGRRVYVTAEVDGFAPVNLGRGPSVGMDFVRRGQFDRFVGVAPATGRRADVRIRYAGGERFIVRVGRTVHKIGFGRLLRIADDRGQAHDVVLRAFDEQPQPLRRPDEG